MKLVRFNSLKYLPASHEDPVNPGVFKKILLTCRDLIPGKVQMINWAKLPIGKSFRFHYHEDLEEIFIVLTGRANLTLDKETVILEKGDTVLIPCKKTHKMANIGKGNLLYLAIGISEKGKGKTVTV